MRDEENEFALQTNADNVTCRLNSAFFFSSFLAHIKSFLDIKAKNELLQLPSIIDIPTDRLSSIKL